jgi:hypothetical protein
MLLPRGLTRLSFVWTSLAEQLVVGFESALSV